MTKRIVYPTATGFNVLCASAHPAVTEDAAWRPASEIDNAKLFDSERDARSYIARHFPDVLPAAFVVESVDAPIPANGMRIVNLPMIRQAIITKWLSPTNVKGSRVKATAEAGSVTLHWDHALNADGNHAAAALALANKFGWTGSMAGGAIPSSGYAFVWLD